MWFIKDPQDQNMYHYKDILERLTFIHLYELFQNLVVHALVVVCGVRNVPLAVLVFTPSLLPLE